MPTLSKFIPSRIKNSIKVLLGKATVQPVASRPGQLFDCPVCEARQVAFQPLSFHYFRELDRNEFVYSIFRAETLNLEHYSCPVCRASDRDRLYALYFKKQPATARNILDFAPAPALNAFLRKLPGARVRTADLFMDGVDDKVDIMDMKIYQEGQFDVVICSHILEHVSDDRKAMREIRRVLRPGGWAIMMVPINLGVEKTHEDPSITDEALRWKYFGQNDHVRMYAKQDFIDRLREAGFTVDLLGKEYFGEEQFRRYGIHSRSVLYIVRK